ncbi:MAG TPA: pyridoxamine 5'-phosphate oxidase family protein [Acidimicrobiales bacterium]
MSEPAERAPVDALVPTDRTTLRRKKERGAYDRTVVDAILDEGLVCHVGFSVEGSTFVIPMAYARIGSTLYLHGATGNRMLRFLGEGAEVCITVTLLDALVLARSAFHHSMNYRSVMLFGTSSRVEGDDEKQQATMALLDHIATGRSADARPPSPEELRAALMIRVPIVEGSAKIRTGGPIDEPEDLDALIWAGHIPLSVGTGVAVADRGLPPGVEEPSYVRAYPARGAPAARRG